MVVIYIVMHVKNSREITFKIVLAEISDPRARNQLTIFQYVVPSLHQLRYKPRGAA